MRNAHSLPSIVTVLLLSSGLASAVCAEASKIYWTTATGQFISQVNADGSGAASAQQSPSGTPIGIDFDEANGKMYWIARNINGLDRVFRGPIDGGTLAEVETLVSTVHGLAGDLVLDLDAGKIYWCAWAGQSPNGGGIYRCNLDGSAAETIVTGLDRPTRLVLHPTLALIYWTDSGNWLIQKASTAGTNLGVATVIPFPNTPEGLAIDFDNGLVYWSEVNTGTIKRATLSGLGIDTVTLVNDLANAGPPRDLGIDFDTGTMYWTDPAHAKIRTSNLAGAGIATLTSAATCVGLAIRFAPEPAPCAGDITGDGLVDGADIAMILGNWGTIGASAFDLNGDGVVDGADLATVLGGWGACP